MAATFALASHETPQLGGAARYIGETIRKQVGGFWDIDLAIMKNTRIRENLIVQFRAEAFNLFNRAQFFAPNTTFGTSSFGVVPGALPARSIQLGMKLYW